MIFDRRLNSSLITENELQIKTLNFKLLINFGNNLTLQSNTSGAG